MANFLAVYDPVQKRRQAFEDKCKKEIAIFDDLKQEELSIEDFTILWAANKNAPVDTYQNKNKVALILGDAILPGSHERISADVLAGEWSELESAQKSFYDGFHCSLHYSIQNGLTIGGDILGLFPIYYYSNSEVILVGSSPELFKYHDCFQPELCLEGLTGMLLTMHSVEGLTLWKSVYRLRAGRLLNVSTSNSAKEVSQFNIPLSDDYFGLPFSRQCDLIHEKLIETFERHAPDNQDYALLFSGGLDSRMFGGYLKNRETRIKAITKGKPSDIEMKLARSAINTLDFGHLATEVPFSNYPEYAELSVKWEHGMEGLNGITSWGIPPLRNQNRDFLRVINGYLADAVLGGSHVNWAFDREKGTWGFDILFENVNKWGIAEDTLEEILKPDLFTGLVAQIKDRLKRTYESYADWEYRRAWLFDMNHRQRFHVGGALWKMCFGAWPVTPVIDSELLKLMGGMPYSTIGERRAQKEIVRIYFPDLAAIPFDNHTPEPEPLISTWPYLVRQKITNLKLFNKEIIRGIGRRLYGKRRKQVRKYVYYERIYNINNKGWKSIRKKADSGRSLTSDIFNQEKLLEFIPPPDENLNKMLRAVSGLKSLLGFLLWVQNH